VHAAALALGERIAALGGNPPDLESCRMLVEKNNGQPIEAKADAKPGEERQRYSMHSFGAVFAEVRVDPDLGDIRVARVVGAYGAGRIINAKTARSQLVGGIVYGLAMALTEHTAIDSRTGRYLNADLGEYLVPVNADVPEIDVILVDEHDPHVNPIGVKGIGEIGTTGVAAAVANAVYHATGVRVRDLPITLDKLL
jgi:xanthine dehydrogenase YagR molybdenum-binding subunit